MNITCNDCGAPVAVVPSGVTSGTLERDPTGDPMRPDVFRCDSCSRSQRVAILVEPAVDALREYARSLRAPVDTATPEARLRMLDDARRAAQNAIGRLGLALLNEACDARGAGNTHRANAANDAWQRSVEQWARLAGDVDPDTLDAWVAAWLAYGEETGR